MGFSLVLWEVSLSGVPALPPPPLQTSTREGNTVHLGLSPTGKGEGGSQSGDFSGWPGAGSPRAQAPVCCPAPLVSCHPHTSANFFFQSLHCVGPSRPDSPASGSPQNHPAGGPSRPGEGDPETVFLTHCQGEPRTGPRKH